MLHSNPQQEFSSCTISFLITFIKCWIPFFKQSRNSKWISTLLIRLFLHESFGVLLLLAHRKHTSWAISKVEIKTGQWPLFQQTASVMCAGSFKRVCTLVVPWEQCWIPAVLVKTSQIEPWLHRCPYNRLLSARPVTLVTFKVSCIGGDFHCLCKYSFVRELRDKMGSIRTFI